MVKHDGTAVLMAACGASRSRPPKRGCRRRAGASNFITAMSPFRPQKITYCSIASAFG